MKTHFTILALTLFCALADGCGGSTSTGGAVTSTAATSAFTGYSSLSQYDLSKVINVQSAPYNAKGDGVTDDTNAISQALRDSYSATGNVTPVYIPKTDTFYKTGPQSLEPGSVVLSNGATLAAPNGSNANGISTLFYGQAIGNGNGGVINPDNLKLIGPLTIELYNKTSYAVYALNSNGTVIKNVTVKGELSSNPFYITNH